jgi:hypothetical protein
MSKSDRQTFEGRLRNLRIDGPLDRPAGFCV